MGKISHKSREADIQLPDNLKCVIRTALELLYSEECCLLNFEGTKESYNYNHAGERSIVFRFAHYLCNLLEQSTESINDNVQFKDYDVDCEYNRNLYDLKRTPEHENGSYPDVIVHKRGTQNSNLLVIEIKTYWNDDTEEDIKKLKWYTDQNPDEKFYYAYSYGLSLILGKKKKDVKYKVVVDGKSDSQYSKLFD